MMALADAPRRLHKPAVDVFPSIKAQVLGLYVHVPFCFSKCSYCAFYSEPSNGDRVNLYVEALLRELELTAPFLQPETIFFGGGTPSLLGAAGLSAVLDAVRESFGLAPDAEVTTEANPESTSPEFFAGLRAAGYTRVSLGMQSTAVHVLAALDRVHSPGRALDAAREAGLAR